MLFMVLGKKKASTLLPSCEPNEQYQTDQPDSQDVLIAAIVA